MKKLFGGYKITWKALILTAVILGISVGLLNSVPALKDTSFTDVAIYFDFWIFCGIFLIMNSESILDSGLKCFLFFLISQPLIYLAEVPFNRMGWGIFVYYKPWFIWTLLTFPMGYIGYFMKQDKWYGLLILVPMLVLLAMGVNTSLSGLMYAFPHHLINLIFVVVTMILYPLGIFKDKKIRMTGLLISIVLILVFGAMPLIKKPVYETTLRCSREEAYFDETYSVTMDNSELGEVSLKYEPNIECYCIHAKFKKPGETKITVQGQDGNKIEYNVVVGKNTYTIEEIEE